MVETIRKVTTMSKYTEYKADLDKLYSLHREVEDRISSVARESDKVSADISTDMKVVINIVNGIKEELTEHKRNFSRHDIAEMGKADKVDSHIQEMSNSIVKVGEELKRVADVSNKSTKAVLALSESLETKDVTTNKRIDEVVARQNKWMGGLAVIGICASVVWLAYGEFRDVVKEKNSELKELKAKFDKLEQRQSVNYGKLNVLTGGKK